MWSKYSIIIVFLLAVQSFAAERVLWSPDGTRLVVGIWETGFYIIDNDGSNLREVREGKYPSWIPDGKIVFRREDGLYSVNSDGTGEEFFHQGVSVSPDGRKVLLEELQDYPNDLRIRRLIKVIDLDTQRVATWYSVLDVDRMVTEDFTAWSPDSNRLAFGVAHGWGMSTPVGLAVMPNPGDMGGGWSGNSWAPDSKSIALEEQDQNATGTSIYAIEIRTRSKRLIVSNASGPSWAPDGKHIAFRRRESDGVTIYVKNLESSEETRVMANSPRYGGPIGWAPDGTRIAFAEQETENFGVRVSIVGVEGDKVITVVGDVSWGQIKAQFR